MATTNSKTRRCIACDTETTNHAYCDRCLAYEPKPSWVLGGEQADAYELARSEYIERLPPLLGGG